MSKSQRSLITTKLVFEIFSRVFEVDFSIDTFRNFIDARSIRTIDDGSQVYTQEKIVEQMSLAIDCIQLVEKRFPGQLGLTEISLIEGASSIWGNQIRYSYSRPEFDAIVISVFHSFSKYPFDEVALNMRRLILGRNSNLQKCYNSMVSQGLKNPLIELDYRDFVNLTEVPLKPPMSGDSELTLEFINIAFKSLDYVLRDQSKAWLNYKKCQNQNAPQVNCAKPIVFENMIQNMSRDFSLIQVRETDARLCTTDAPQCAKEESLTAINIPDEKLIIISKEKWRASDVNTKIKLALHEVFGIFGLEVNDYHTSAHFAPLVYIEEFNIEFLADEFRQFLIKKNLFPLYVGDFYDHLQFQNRAILLMDCINLVEERFPGRLNIGVVSLRSEHSWSGLMIESNLIFRVLNLYSRFSRLSPKFSHLENLGTEGLYIDENTTLQQCYNKVVALGLK
ncbi:MAG: hypothetical protein JNM39_01015 [Bdellovibrionaceae bacterium]|nr:hypothetical protein [Pseudobdellovibrionaceae bacterium]